MENPSCKTCRFFKPITDDIGQCRRNPPSHNLPLILGDMLDAIEEVKADAEDDDYAEEMAYFIAAQGVDETNLATWPKVDLGYDPWCGEYQPTAPLQPNRPDFTEFARSLSVRLRKILMREKVDSWDKLFASKPFNWRNFGMTCRVELLESIESANIQKPPLFLV